VAWLGTAALTAVALGAMPSSPPRPQPAAEAAATPADALLDLMQPATPVPVFLDPKSAADPAALATALEIDDAAGQRPAADPVNTATLGGYLDQLGRRAHSSTQLFTLLDVLRVDAQDHVGLLTAARQQAVEGFLPQAVPTARTSTCCSTPWRRPRMYSGRSARAAPTRAPARRCTPSSPTRSPSDARLCAQQKTVPAPRSSACCWTPRTRRAVSNA
jgi:hypothetical protein